MIKTYFDDYKNLLSYDFGEYKYVIFYGKSGSGKSTYTSKLLLENTSLRGEKRIVIDEIFNFLDFLKKCKYLFSSQKYIICSHLSKKYFFIFSLFGKIKYINLDTSEQKICNYLDYKNITYSKNEVKRFIKKYKSNYTDIDIILEHATCDNFDILLRNFEKYKSITLTKHK